MAETTKSLTSLILLLATTALFAAGWSSDAAAQRQYEDGLARKPEAAAPETPHAAPPQSARTRQSVTRLADPSPLARLAPGRYRMADAGGRIAWLLIEDPMSSGLPPQHRATLLNIDGTSLVLVREESASPNSRLAHASP
jgi:hypothetical protein